MCGAYHEKSPKVKRPTEKSPTEKRPKNHPEKSPPPFFEKRKKDRKWKKDRHHFWGGRKFALNRKKSRNDSEKRPPKKMGYNLKISKYILHVHKSRCNSTYSFNILISCKFPDFQLLSTLFCFSYFLAISNISMNLYLTTHHMTLALAQDSLYV